MRLDEQEEPWGAGGERSPPSWQPPAEEEMKPLGVIDNRSERWKAAEARIAASHDHDPADLAIIEEEQALADKADHICVPGSDGRCAAAGYCPGCKVPA